MSNWPNELTPDPDLVAAAQPALAAACARMQLSEDETAQLLPPVMGLAGWLLRNLPRPGLLGLAGSQGSGKSTIAELLAITFSEVGNAHVATLSIDDFYLTRAEREQLSTDVHPLLRTRGVAGTHDMALMQSVISALLRGETVATPRFNKAVDDREPEPESIAGPVDIVIVEGWCVGARPEPQASLANPINDLEAAEDPEGAWRGFVNSRLAAADYRRVFDGFDRFVFLQVPGMDSVFNWRLRQEEMLRVRAGDQSGVMDAAGVARFIMHYERITRNMLRELPAVADVVFSINEAHEIESGSLRAGSTPG